MDQPQRTAWSRAVIERYEAPLIRYARLVKAQVPMRSMFGYSTKVRSITQGRASFTMQFLKFDVAGS